MKKFNETYVIGIDHGYGNTQNACVLHRNKQGTCTASSK